MIKAYYHLTKPGIIYGNILTMTAGFVLGLENPFSPRLFLATLIGLCLVIASACVFNNIFDKDIDAKMARTKHRSMVTGAISKRNALTFGLILITLGILDLYFYTHIKVLLVGLLGFVVYVFFYTPLKPRTTHATLIGGIAGATPPVVGYVASSNRLDLGAWLLFLILVVWQMAHFYSIAIRRQDEYAAAAIPVLPLQKGFKLSQIHIVFYILLFIVSTVLLFVYDYTGVVYLAIVGLLALAWLWKGLTGFTTSDHKTWAKEMFLFSLLVLTSFCVSIIIDGIIQT